MGGRRLGPRRGPLLLGVVGLALASASAPVLLTTPAPAAAAVSGVELVDVNSAEQPADLTAGQASLDAAYGVSVSGDGRFVVFSSVAGNLTGGHSAGGEDVFVRDRQAGTTALVSVGLSGGPGQGDSFSPAISADGRYVAFVSRAADLVAGDTNLDPEAEVSGQDVFVRDLLAASTVRVSVGSPGVQANGVSREPAISADGAVVAFASTATSLLPAPADQGPARSDTSQVFVRDLRAGTTTLLSATAAGAPGAGYSDRPALSADGQLVTFESTAADLAAASGPDSNGAADVFLADRATGATSRLSSADGGGPADGPSTGPSISADGQRVAFTTSATNLTGAPDGNQASDVVVLDRATGVTALASTTPGGAPAGDGSEGAALSADGSAVVFTSRAADLVGGDSNAAPDVFRRDLAASTTLRVSTGAGGVQSDAASKAPAISADGTAVVFLSAAGDLAAGDEPNADDAFLRVLAPPAPAAALTRPAGAAARTRGGQPIRRSAPVAISPLRAAGGAAADSGTPPTDPLFWKPPPHSTWTVVHVPVTSPAPTYMFVLNLGATENAQIIMPTTKRVGGITINGGNDITVIGGRITIPGGAATPDRAFATAFTLNGVAGIAHFEGLRIDNSGDPTGVIGAPLDAFKIHEGSSCAQPVQLQIENVRYVSPERTAQSKHSDGVQPSGGVAALRMDHDTLGSAFDNLFLRQEFGDIGVIKLRNLNINTTDNNAAQAMFVGESYKTPAIPPGGCPAPHLIANGDGVGSSNDLDHENCDVNEAWRLRMTAVSVNTDLNQTLPDVVHPGSNPSCPLELSGTGDTGSWQNYYNGHAIATYQGIDFVPDRQTGVITRDPMYTVSDDQAPACTNPQPPTLGTCPGLNYKTPGYLPNTS